MAGATWAVKKLYKEHESVVQVRHVLEVMEMPGANHFVCSFHSIGHMCELCGRQGHAQAHWDDPDSMI